MLSGSHFGLRNIYSQGHIFNHLWCFCFCLFVCLSVFSASVPMRLVLKQSVLRNNRSAGARLRVNRCQRLLGPNHTLFNCSTLLGKRATLASASIYSASKTCPALPTVPLLPLLLSLPLLQGTTATLPGAYIYQTLPFSSCWTQFWNRSISLRNTNEADGRLTSHVV